MNRYFYDQSKKYFLNTCLPSQLNPIRQRKREYDQIDYIQIPSERLSHFPSYVDFAFIYLFIGFNEIYSIKVDNR